MGKRIIQQARGHGSLTYRVRRKAFKHKIKYPKKLEGEAEVLKLINSGGHSAPIAKLKMIKQIKTEKKEKGKGKSKKQKAKKQKSIEKIEKIFYNVAAKNLAEGEKINFREKNSGNILQLKEIPVGTKIFNIENIPEDGGKFIRSGGGNAILTRKSKGKATILLPSKKEKIVDNKCRATIGEVAGHGRLEKPLIKAGKKYYLMKTKSKLWPRTSAIKVNAVDHRFGSGRGKNPKRKIAKRNAPAGAKVGQLRPKRTGRKKR